MDSPRFISSNALLISASGITFAMSYRAGLPARFTIAG
jgi:hypothetical protein